MGAVVENQFQPREKKDYQQIDSGLYPARCVHVIDLGTRDNEYQGVVKKRREVLIVWELNELMEDGRPFTVYWRGTMSMFEQGKLYKLLTDWRGKAFTPEELARFEMKNLLDKGCMVNVIKEEKKGKTFNKVMGAVPMPKGFTLEERQNPLVDFGISDLGTPEFDKLWPWVQKLVKESDEGKRFYAGQTIEDKLPEGSIPF